MLEISHLRFFIAVAEELHFGRAAARLNITQPPLSRKIRLLEHSMKCTLLDRDSRTVKLTNAGRAFLPEARRVLRILEAATQSAQDVAAGRSGIVRCGFTASSAYEFLPRFVARLKRDIPDASMLLSELVSREQSAALRSGEIEVGVLRAASELNGFEIRLLTSEPLVAALPAGHALALRDNIAWSDLHGQRFLGYQPQQAKYFNDLIGARLASEEIEPNFVQELAQIHSILSLVRAGTGVAVVPKSAKVMAFSDVVYREFNDKNSTDCQLFVVWHADNQNPLVPLIANIATLCGEYPSSVK